MHYCPHCSEPLPEGAKACRACGSDEETGWSTQAVEGLPEDPVEIPDYLPSDDELLGTRGMSRKMKVGLILFLILPFTGISALSLLERPGIALVVLFAGTVLISELLYNAQVTHRSFFRRRTSS